MIDKALKLAFDAYAGKLDDNGYSGILRPLSLGMMGNTEDEKLAGFLYDAVCDGLVSYEQIVSAGIFPEVADALELIAFKDMEDDAKVQKVIDSRNPISLQVLYNALSSRTEGSALAKVKAVVGQRSRVELYNPATKDYAYFACGCFWGVQHIFNRTAGVLRTFAGYTGGDGKPDYASVREHRSNHIEAVAVEYDPSLVSYTDLCKIFFEMHDPSQTDGVGPDIGHQYRSCLFFRNDGQRKEASEVIGILRSKGYEVNTLLLDESEFWIAEEYHQDYYTFAGGTPYCHVREKKF